MSEKKTKETKKEDAGYVPDSRKDIETKIESKDSSRTQEKSVPKEIDERSKVENLKQKERENNDNVVESKNNAESIKITNVPSSNESFITTVQMQTESYYTLPPSSGKGVSAVPKLFSYHPYIPSSTKTFPSRYDIFIDKKGLITGIKPSGNLCIKPFSNELEFKRNLADLMHRVYDFYSPIIYHIDVVQGSNKTFFDNTASDPGSWGIKLFEVMTQFPKENGMNYDLIDNIRKEIRSLSPVNYVDEGKQGELMGEVFGFAEEIELVQNLNRLILNQYLVPTTDVRALEMLVKYLKLFDGMITVVPLSFSTLSATKMNNMHFRSFFVPLNNNFEIMMATSSVFRNSYYNFFVKAIQTDLYLPSDRSLASKLVKAMALKTKTTVLSNSIVSVIVKYIDMYKDADILATIAYVAGNGRFGRLYSAIMATSAWAPELVIEAILQRLILKYSWVHPDHRFNNSVIIVCNYLLYFTTHENANSPLWKPAYWATILDRSIDPIASVIPLLDQSIAGPISEFLVSDSSGNGWAGAGDCTIMHTPGYEPYCKSKSYQYVGAPFSLNSSVESTNAQLKRFVAMVNVVLTANRRAPSNTSAYSYQVINALLEFITSNIYSIHCLVNLICRLAHFSQLLPFSAPYFDGNNISNDQYVDDLLSDSVQHYEAIAKVGYFPYMKNSAKLYLSRTEMIEFPNHGAISLILCRQWDNVPCFQMPLKLIHHHYELNQVFHFFSGAAVLSILGLGDKTVIPYEQWTYGTYRDAAIEMLERFSKRTLHFDYMFPNYSPEHTDFEWSLDSAAVSLVTESLKAADKVYFPLDGASYWYDVFTLVKNYIMKNPISFGWVPEFYYGHGKLNLDYNISMMDRRELLVKPWAFSSVTIDFNVGGNAQEVYDVDISLVRNGFIGQMFYQVLVDNMNSLKLTRFCFPANYQFGDDFEKVTDKFFVFSTKSAVEDNPESLISFDDKAQYKFGTFILKHLAKTMPLTNLTSAPKVRTFHVDQEAYSIFDVNNVGKYKHKFTCPTNWAVFTPDYMELSKTNTLLTNPEATNYPSI